MDSSPVPSTVHAIPTPETGPSRSQRGVRPLILVAEQDRCLRRHLRGILSDAYRVIEASTAGDALAQASACNPDVAVVGLTLPGGDAVALTSKLRGWTTTPILVISSCSEEARKVAVLDAGANDYVTTPFRPGEVLARIRVWLRSTQRVHGRSMDTELTVQDLRIDFSQQRAFAAGREIKLTPKQYRLFAVLMRNAGKVVSHETLLAAVWGPAYTGETHYLRVYMGHLRQKFGDQSAREPRFLTEPGIGYRLRVEPLGDARAPSGEGPTASTLARPGP